MCVLYIKLFKLLFLPIHAQHTQCPYRRFTLLIEGGHKLHYCCNNETGMIDDTGFAYSQNTAVREGIWRRNSKRNECESGT